MGNVSTAQSLLQKWLTSQEPTNQLNSEERIILTDYLNARECERIHAALLRRYPDEAETVTEMLESTLRHIAPVAMVMRAQFQAITDKVFTIDGTAFSSAPVCALIKKSEFVFPHIITSGKEIEDFALEHTDSLHRQVMHFVCSQAHLTGQNLIIEKLVERYGVQHLIPVLPGEPDWARYEGVRIFDLFEKLPQQFNITITESGIPNVANTSYGLLIGN